MAEEITAAAAEDGEDRWRDTLQALLQKVHEVLDQTPAATQETVVEEGHEGG